MRCLLSTIVLGFLAIANVQAQDAWPPIPRLVPPRGMELSPDETQALQTRTKALEERIQRDVPSDEQADVAIFTKAVRYALKFHEFYSPGDVAKARTLLDEAERRLDAMANGRRDWLEARGTVVRGFRSAVDDSPQPYGLVIPRGLDLSRPVPLYVWLHGRGDKTTDLHFIDQRMKQPGQITPANAIVLHPFGRQCLGYKSAGETDVLEALAAVRSHYPIDPDRIVLIGFSMGGAGAWHLGAHYADHWVAVSPGAGFAETARYQKLDPANYPPPYEQALWGVYDVPDYVRNLFNVPVIAYSGERDKQIQAARVMEEAFQAEGRTLTHLIGPGVEHRYEPGTLKVLLEKLDALVAEGRPSSPRRVSLQTRTLRYSRQFWVQALRLEQHWKDSRIDAERTNDSELNIVTRNITAMQCTLPPGTVRRLMVDGEEVTPIRAAENGTITLHKNKKETWRCVDAASLEGTLSKKPGLQGPIDDAFLDPFLVVVPTGPFAHELPKRWVQFELEHFSERWQALFRGRLRMKRDVEVTDEDLRTYHVILWGDPTSNRIMQRVFAHSGPSALPIRWDAQGIRVAGAVYAAEHHVPVFTFPNPLAPEKYVVINSGPTFREAHDRTNSLQNPKLPDWTIVDLHTAPDAVRPGRIVAADFFDEQWRLRP